MYDVIIIGAGPGGMTAALYAGRANLRVGLVEKAIPGGQMNNTADIENYPGVGLISGAELSENMYAQLEAYENIEHIFATVQSIEKDDHFTIKTDDGDLTSKTVIIASGAQHRHLNVEGESEFEAKGVSYCAICDGAFFKDKDIIVVGGGDSALEEADFLTQYASLVTIVHRRDEFRAQKVLQDRVFANKKIDIYWNSIVTGIYGDNTVTGVQLQDTQFFDCRYMKTDGVFIYVGLDPISDFTPASVKDESGYIKTNENMETSIPGLYAIGDVRANQLRQIATAVGDGAKAGQNAYNYIVENK